MKANTRAVSMISWVIWISIWFAVSRLTINFGQLMYVFLFFVMVLRMRHFPTLWKKSNSNLGMWARCFASGFCPRWYFSVSGLPALFWCWLWHPVQPFPGPKDTAGPERAQHAEALLYKDFQIIRGLEIFWRVAFPACPLALAPSFLTAL